MNSYRTIPKVRFFLAPRMLKTRENFQINPGMRCRQNVWISWALGRNSTEVDRTQRSQPLDQEYQPNTIQNYARKYMFLMRFVNRSKLVYLKSFIVFKYNIFSIYKLGTSYIHLEIILVVLLLYIILCITVYWSSITILRLPTLLL